MSDAEGNSVENEHNIFVELLKKYSVLLDPEKTPMMNQRKTEAAIEFANEYNRICNTKLKMKQIIKKLRNMKARVKEKNYRNSVRKHKLPYLEWERMFLDLWVGNDTLVMPNKISGARKRSKVQTPTDFSHNLEQDDHSCQDSSRISEDTSFHFEKFDTESSSRYRNEENKYECMSFAELERSTLIAQMKMFKAQEDAAYANEVLQLYKLSVLKRQTMD